MKLCGVIELFLGIEYACGVLGRLAETISGDVVAARVKSRLAGGCQSLSEEIEGAIAARWRELVGSG
jgi:hypothetical protein